MGGALLLGLDPRMTSPTMTLVPDSCPLTPDILPRMRRPDRYDYIGIALLALVVALWVAHIVLPPLPPEPLDPLAPVQTLPSVVPPGQANPGLPKLPSIRPPGR